MKSKILIDVIDGGKPAIKVVMPDFSGIEFGKVDELSLDLRDKVVRMFFDSLGTESSFVGVISEKNGSNTKFLVPMDIPRVLEWLHRTFAEKIARSDSQLTGIHEVFKELNRIYHNDPKSSFSAVERENLTARVKESLTARININQTQ